MFSFFRRNKGQDEPQTDAQTQPAGNPPPSEPSVSDMLAALEKSFAEQAAQPNPPSTDLPSEAVAAEIIDAATDDNAVAAEISADAPNTDEAAANHAETAAMPSEHAGVSAAGETLIVEVQTAADQTEVIEVPAEPAVAMPSETDAPSAVEAPVVQETVAVEPVETIAATMPSETKASEAEAPSAVEAPVVAETVAETAAPKLGWAARLKQGLTKSRDHMAKSLAGVFGGGKIDEDLYEELETVLITSDMGMEATDYLMKDVRRRVSLRGLKDGEELRGALKEAIYDLIKPLEQPLVLPQTDGEPFVIMLAGINGAGKTTSIGKLAKYFQAQGKSVLLAAGDTFRAAAREQLQEWGARNNVTVISQTTGDSAAVCFDAVQAAKARGIDIVLADTAGRLPTQLHLMEEIKKVKRVLQKAMPAAPHEIIVVLDANIGQNAVNQVKAFDDALGLTGLIVTKLDGTAKGGILAALASNRPIPVRYIGVGEGIDDLRPFDARAFVDALLD